MLERIPDYEVIPILFERWSLRSFTGQPLSHEVVMQLFEAARWAPSSYNNQPWRFIYAHRDTPEWQPLFELLVPFNQSWVKQAGILILVCSTKNFAYNGESSPTHSFDTGAACQNLALQAAAMGLCAHGMGGFDYEKARTAFDIPDAWSVEAMFAVGYPGKKSDLPQALQEHEVPSGRNQTSSFIFEGSLKKHA